MNDIACSAKECKTGVRLEQCLDFWIWKVTSISKIQYELTTFSQLFHLVTYLSSVATVSYYLLVHCLLSESLKYSGPRGRIVAIALMLAHIWILCLAMTLGTKRRGTIPSGHACEASSAR